MYVASAVLPPTFYPRRCIPGNMIIPRPIAEGDHLGVTAPSFGVDDPLDVKRFSNAKAKMSARGYEVVETPDVYGCIDEQGRSATADQRVLELNSLLEDPDVSAVFSAKGGDYQFEMLPKMDWDLLESNPKWFQGYSDNTTLAFVITAEHDIATMYCGNFGDFGMEDWHPSISQNLEFLEGRRTSQHSFRYHATDFIDRVTGLESFGEDEPTVWGTTVEGRFSGRLIGGCMDVLEWFHAKGTADPMEFLERYGSDGIIWYMETYDMTGDRISTMLNGMRDDGWFEDCTGFVFGRPLFYQGDVGYRELVETELKDLEVPVVTDADVGHKAPRMTFINGALATFDVNGGECELRYKLRGDRLTP